MKPIEELNISPYPWNSDACDSIVVDKHGMSIVDYLGDFWREDDCVMSSAAPEMYQYLSEAVEDKCRRCKEEWYGKCVTADGKDCEIIARWKSVLAKAAGERE